MKLDQLRKLRGGVRAIAEVLDAAILELSPLDAVDLSDVSSPIFFSLEEARDMITHYISANGPDDILKAFNSLGHEKLSDLSDRERTDLCNILRESS